MYCSNCGKEINDNAIFCPYCGFNKNDKNNFNGQNNNKSVDLGKIVKIFSFLAIFALILFLLVSFVVPNVLNLFETAKILKDSYGNEYYEDKDGNKIFNSWIIYKGKEYHLDNKGYIDKEKWVDRYYVDEHGNKVISDWVIWNNTYYYMKDDGTYAFNEILDIDKEKYGFDTQGKLYHKTFFADPVNIGQIYYANETGAIQIDKFTDIDGFTYYFDNNGNKLINGWHEIKNGWYYFLNNGVLVKSNWVDGKYYVDENGKMLKNGKAPNGILLDDNGEIIPGQSMLEGTVVILTGGSSMLRTIEGAEVDFYNTKDLNEKVGTTYTDAQGKYQYYLPKSNYKIVVNADGYEPMDSTETINENENKYTELLSLFPSGQQGNGTAIGRLTNALDGKAVSNAVLKIRKNWNNFTGDLATNNTYQTDTNGYFLINNLPVGYYTIEASKNNFITGYNNIALLSENPISDYYFSINPEMPSDGNIRIVLTWGENPLDLDSHLIGRKPNGNYFDVYYSNKVYTYNGIAMANLDVDDTSSYGPETETITSDLNGTYVYGIYDYSNGGSSNSNKLSYSNCKITVYMGSQVVAIYNVPTGKIGTFWEVFRINEDRTITPINQIYNYSPSSSNYQRFNLEQRVNPKYSAVETNVSRSENSSNTQTNLGGSNNQTSSNGVYTLSYGDTINEEYDYEEDKEVRIKIRQPIINGPNTTTTNKINQNINFAMEELVVWCEEYIDEADKAPKTINIHTSTIEAQTGNMIKIKMTGTITFRSTDTRNITFSFTHNFGTDEYTISKDS